jgi:hypothetical protein
MMFALRGIAVSLTFFVLIYGGLSALVAVGWRSLKLFQASDRALADVLFASRISPLVASIVLTLAFVVPSFQLLEPRAIDERIGAIPLALGVCALLLIAWGCFRVIDAHLKTSRMITLWIDGSRPVNIDYGARVITFSSKENAAPIMLVGVRNPQVLVSDSTLELLNHDELQIALKHELAHMRSHDNLKKLIFRFCPFPGMGRLESTWCHTTELAADGAAVSRCEDAVDLAAALVKLSRLVPVEASGVCIVGFVTGSIRARVARLLEWHETAIDQQAPSLRHYAVPALLVVALPTLVCAFFTYGPALQLTHEITEWVVR